MSLKTKKLIIGLLGFMFLLSLVFVQWMEVARKQEEAGLVAHAVSIPANSSACVDCHRQSSPGIIDHWTGSTHAEKGVGCVECHQAQKGDVDAFTHYGELIATIVTPKDCARCHKEITEEFMASHHAKAGNILASLDNFLAETVEGSRVPFNPHSPTPGRDFNVVDGMASVNVGCKQCHGSEIALEGTDGSLITVKELQPDKDGKPTNLQAVSLVKKTESGRPVLHASSWPNTGVGRINLDGSRGSCSACHSRHDFSPRRARQPENCGKCHLGPDHPQKEIYEESKHGVAFRDLHDKMNLDATPGCLAKIIPKHRPARPATCRAILVTEARLPMIRGTYFLDQSSSRQPGYGHGHQWQGHHGDGPCRAAEVDRKFLARQTNGNAASMSTLSYSNTTLMLFTNSMTILS